MGSKCGKDAFALAKKYFDGTITNEPFACDAEVVSAAACRVSWEQSRGLYYRLDCSTNPATGFLPLMTYTQACDATGEYIVSNLPVRVYYRARRSETAGP